MPKLVQVVGSLNNRLGKPGTRPKQAEGGALNRWAAPHPLAGYHDLLDQRPPVFTRLGGEAGGSYALISNHLIARGDFGDVKSCGLELGQHVAWDDGLDDETAR
jgi:hypothetical protein